jgi:4-hydroxy-tetrahydrodipicolinate reductase
MTDIAICGIRGRMGQTLVRLAHDASDLRIVGGIDTIPGEEADYRVVTMDNASSVIADAEVIIDFSAADATCALTEVSNLRGRAIVIGTTGLDDAATHKLDACAQRTALLSAANFSIGVNLLLALAETAAATLGAEQYDVEIVEAHHNRKADAPSGTAIALGHAVAKGRAVSLSDLRRDGRSGQTGARPRGEVGFHAVRGGGVVGEHRLMFLGERERIELVHEATDRALFAEGALRAARWIAGREPGRYTMREVLGL